jgi:hypothetical protein
MALFVGLTLLLIVAVLLSVTTVRVSVSESAVGDAWFTLRFTVILLSGPREWVLRVGRR